MRVLFVSSEIFPLIKTGGLADVSGALPTALQASGIDVKCLIPGYSTVLEKVENITYLGTLEVFKNISCDLLTGTVPNSKLEVIIVKHAGLYERDGGPYTHPQGHDWSDNPMRFGVLSKVASLLSIYQSFWDWVPDIVHCNDWQTGLAPYYMRQQGLTDAKSLLSIHNIAFQGNFEQHWVKSLELSPKDFQIDGFEFYQQVSFLKAGIFYADKLSTVSPTYALEIQTEAFGFGLQGLLQLRSSDITGILNGIDTEEWNPEADPYLPFVYSEKKLSGKAKVKTALQQQLHLTVQQDAPLLGVVSRLTHQKGLDILIGSMPELIALGCQFAILGGGEKSFEAQFNAYAEQYPNQVSVTIGYNEPLSHLIMAGVDIFMMPSRFEPCGLNQLYGLRYGTPPVVSNTGGLADSICHSNADTILNNTATGFVIENVNKMSLLVTIKQALSIWKDKKTWAKIQKNGMKKDVGWKHSADAYVALYEKLLN
ncbi:MAG: glycogen synthase GlgA [Methylophilus sp.]|nr:glycogen synthase GlgA [Methylophilus sp.]